jgi:hypothetical protein
MSEKKEFVVIVQSIYEEQYFVEADSVEELTPKFVEKKGQFEETRDFVKILNIQEAEELEDPGPESLVLKVPSAASVADMLNNSNKPGKAAKARKEGPVE